MSFAVVGRVTLERPNVRECSRPSATTDTDVILCDVIPFYHLWFFRWSEPQGMKGWEGGQEATTGAAPPGIFIGGLCTHDDVICGGWHCTSRK